jgi:WD40 repeat protein
LGLAGSGNVATWSLRDESARFAASSREFRGGFSAKFVPDNRLLVAKWNEGGQFHSLSSNELPLPESTARQSTATSGKLFSHAGNYMLWALEVSPDFKHVITGAKDNTARLWLAESGEPVGEPLQHDDDVRCVTFSRDGMLAATGSFDRTARLWSVDTTRSIGKPLEHPNIVEDVCFSPDGKRLATACGDGGLRIWLVETGELAFPVHHIGASLLGVSYSPDGKLIAFCSRDGTARFLDASTGTETGHVLQHSAWVEDIDFSSDGKILATASDNGVFLWSVSIGELLGPALKTHDAPIFEVELDLKNNLVVGSTGSHHHLWKLPKIEIALEADPTTWVEVQTWSRMDDSGVMLRIKREHWLLLQQELQRSSKRTQEPFN